MSAAFRPGPRVLAALLWLCVLGLGAVPHAEAAVVGYDIDRLTRASHFIVCGRVVAIESYWGSIGELGPVILTDVTLEVSDAWKGTPEKGKITIQLLGGRIGDRWQFCAESPRFTSGEEVLVFARRFNGRLWATGWAQGKYRIVPGPSGREIVGQKKHPIETTTDLKTIRGRVREILERYRPAGASAGGKSEVTDPGKARQAESEVRR